MAPSIEKSRPDFLLEREEPRSRLEAALKAARSSHGRIVSIEGEAGIGKTSLVSSFAESQRRGARVYIGGCEHLAAPEPLGPLRDIAREIVQAVLEFMPLVVSEIARIARLGSGFAQPGAEFF